MALYMYTSNHNFGTGRLTERITHFCAVVKHLISHLPGWSSQPPR